MDIKTAAFFMDCEDAIKSAYETSVTMEDAEKLAAKFIHAQIIAAQSLRETDLDARMRKSGLKAVKASVYLAESKKGDKKPTEATLEALVNTNQLVSSTQTQLDESEVQRDILINYLSVFKEGHIYFRGIAKGNFNG